MSEERFRVGDYVRITNRPAGRGPMVGMSCLVTKVGLRVVYVEDKDTGHPFAKRFGNVEPLDADLRLDAGL